MKNNNVSSTLRNAKATMGDFAQNLKKLDSEEMYFIFGGVTGNRGSSNATGSFYACDATKVCCCLKNETGASYDYNYATPFTTPVNLNDPAEPYYGQGFIIWGDGIYNPAP